MFDGVAAGRMQTDPLIFDKWKIISPGL